VPFELDPETRRRLLEGLDEIALSEQQGDAIDAYEAARDGWIPPVPVTTAL
jgi:3-isopropylmalate/(R)-2-methylmalate dehydratase small subunit